MSWILTIAMCWLEVEVCRLAPQISPPSVSTCPSDLAVNLCNRITFLLVLSLIFWKNLFTDRPFCMVRIYRIVHCLEQLHWRIVLLVGTVQNRVSRFSSSTWNQGGCRRCNQERLQPISVSTPICTLTGFTHILCFLVLGTVKRILIGNDVLS